MCYTVGFVVCVEVVIVEEICNDLIKSNVISMLLYLVSEYTKIMGSMNVPWIKFDTNQI